MTIEQLSMAGNELLNSFGNLAWERLASHLERVNVPKGRILCWPGDRLTHVYFPNGAVLSTTKLLENGTAIETAVFGREGAFGLLEAIYSHRAHTQCRALMEGGLLRVPFEVLLHLFEREGQIRSLFDTYSLKLRAEIEQAVVCYAAHTIQQRICRRLLLVGDRADKRDLPFTHECLAHFLGASRKSVTLALEHLSAKGIIRNTRGKIVIVDRPRLERAACECHAALKARLRQQ